jgi:D-glycero-D-manno-heptose 1,7-bisphosphate phosphatase
MKSQLDLVILCGGKGTRLGDLTKNTPKPLMKIDKVTFLEKLIKYYQKFNFKKIYLLAGYKGYKIKSKFDNKKFNFIECKVFIENFPLGTGGALSLIKGRIKNNFLLINGDSFVEYNIKDFIKTKKIFLAKILITENKNYKSNKKLIGLELKKNYIQYNKKNSKYINAGVYLFNKKILYNIKKNFISLESELIPNLINRNMLLGYKSKGFFIDIGLKKNLKYARINLRRILKKPAVFFDRDGVLNHDYGYVFKYKDFKWMPGSLDSLKYLNDIGYYIFIITNQSGIGRGYYTEKDFDILHYKIKQNLSKKNIYIQDVFFCPHHPTEGKGKFKKKCQCRKPENLMVKNILNIYDINIKKSFFIGDKLSDEICAKKSNIYFEYRKKNLLKQIKKIVK